MDPSLRSASSTGPHSRACVNCARAKTKCITIPGQSKCGRCDRLKKECQAAIPIRKARAAKKPAANKTALLEEKLDGIFSLLKSGAPPSALASTQAVTQLPTQSDSQLYLAPSNAQLQTPAGSIPDENPGAGAAYVAENACHHSFCQTFNVGTTTRCKVPTSPNVRNGRPFEAPYEKDACVDPPTKFFQPQSTDLPNSISAYYHPSVDTTHPSLDEAKELLGFFASRMLSYFPFMKMPPHKDPADFRKQHPFLFLCILAVASKSTEQQIALGREIRNSLGRKMLIESERSLDLLQGLLVYCGWSQSHIHTNPIVTNLVQLAIGLLGDLGIKRAPIKPASNNLVLNYDPRDYSKPYTVPSRTTEERRTAVAVYYISSVLSAHFQRIEPLRWTPYLDECLQVLEETQDAHTDIAFVHKIRLQLLNEKALSLTSHDDFGEAKNPALAPTGFYRKSLLAQLEAFKRAIPPELEHDETLLMAISITELSIHEIALSSSPATSSAPNFERAEAFFACLRAAKDWFEILSRIPPALWVGFSMSIFTYLAHCTITLYRLSTFEAAGWDQRLARETIEYSKILGEIVRLFKQVKSAAGLDVGVLEDIDVYSLASHRFSTVKNSWETKLAAEAVPVTSNAEAKDEVYMDCVDDLWLKDILGMSWEEYESEYMQTL